MSDALRRIRFTAMAMEHMIRGLEDLKQTVLPKDPIMFGIMSEGPIDTLDDLRKEIIQLVDSIQAEGSAAGPSQTPAPIDASAPQPGQPSNV